MADSLWSAVRSGAGNFVDAVGSVFAPWAPDTGISEWIAGGPTLNTQAKASTNNAQPTGQNMSVAPGVYDQNGKQIGSSATRQTVNTVNNSTPPPAQNNNNSSPTGNPRYTELKKLSDIGDLNPSQKTEWEQLQQTINQGSNDQQAAAERAAEARRQAAGAKYGAQVSIAESAKGMAKESYDWLVDTIGSNKQDLLSQVALQEKQGLGDYQVQEEKTRRDYDGAKQEILSTYRDLQQEQEKILRGSGMGSSSRSQEAQLRLNSLLGKDISQVRTNEADSLAMIGNALTKFKENITQTNIGIERESTSKLDKAALDYNQQVKSIDANLTLSAAEREEAYAQAEAQLATDTQSITQWAVGLKTQAQQAQMQMQNELDGFVSNMLDENGALNTGLDQKRTATNDLLTKMGYTPMETNPTAAEPGVGVYQKANRTYKDKESLDAALQSGEITPLDYQNQLQQMQISSAPTSAVASTSQYNPSTETNSRATSASRDPLLSALFA